MAKRKRTWHDLSTPARVAVVGAAAVQLSLLGLAHADLSRRSAAQVRGPKRLWRVATFVNFAGPIAYFVYGRRRAPLAAA